MRKYYKILLLEIITVLMFSCSVAQDDLAKTEPDSTVFISEKRDDLLNGVVTLSAEMPVAEPSADGTSIITQKRKVTAIPYYTWCNRGAGQMQVWLPRKVTDIRLGN